MERAIAAVEEGARLSLNRLAQEMLERRLSAGLTLDDIQRSNGSVQLFYRGVPVTREQFEAFDGADRAAMAGLRRVALAADRAVGA